jgi:hypothetical protein
MRGPACHSAEQIKGEKAAAPDRVLDVVAEHEQKQHVQQNMQPAAVQEHVCDDGERRRKEPAGHRFAAEGNREQREVEQDLGRDLVAGPIQKREDRDVDRDQRERHVGAMGSSRADRCRRSG